MRSRSISSALRLVNTWHCRFATGDQHVQTASTALVIEGTEIVGNLTCCITSIAHADEDDIPFITLHVFQVLDEEWLLRVG